MPTIRSFVRPKQFIKPITSDTNNNELSTVPLSTSLNPKIPHNNSIMNKQVSTALEKDSIPSEETHQKNLEILKKPIEQFNEIHTTSTPHLNHKLNKGFGDQRLSDMASFDADEFQVPNLNRTSTSIHTKLAESVNTKVY